MSGNFTCPPDEVRIFGSDAFFLLNSENFQLLYCQRFEFTSGKSQGNVREFWSILIV